MLDIAPKNMKQSEVKNKKISTEFSLDRSLYEEANVDHSSYKSKPGVREEVVREISKQKNEPAWMLEKRLQALALFLKTALPNWGPSLKKLNLDEIVYYSRPGSAEQTRWEDVPEDIKKTFDKLGIPEAEKNQLAGVGAQYDSGMVYHSLQKELSEKGVIFCNMDTALTEHETLVKKYFMSRCVPINDHKFAMLHAAVWSGGTFIYVPKNVTVELPLQPIFG